MAKILFTTVSANYAIMQMYIKWQMERQYNYGAQMQKQSGK